MNYLRQVLIGLYLFCTITAQSQLVVTVSHPKIVGQKAVVPLVMKNGLSEKVESARAVIFLLDQQGKMIAQGTQWVIGGNQDKAGLDAGATNMFYFVVSSAKPFASTNLIPKLSISRLVLAGGRIADPNKEVEIHNHIQ